MNGYYVMLGPMDLIFAAILIVVAGGISMVLSLGIHKSLFVSAIRMIIQLLLVGYILGYVFHQGSPLLVGIVLLVMLGAASYEIAARQENRRTRCYGLNFMILTVSSVGVGAIGLVGLLTAGAPHVLDAQHIIPMFGVILGSSMNSTALALNTYTRQIVQQSRVIDTRLALGENFRQATADIVKSATISGAIPLINQMAGAGLITLPGIMSGQLLVGQSPVQAAFYQIFLMALLALVSVICITLVITIFSRRVSDHRQRLRLDRILDFE